MSHASLSGYNDAGLDQIRDEKLGIGTGILLRPSGTNYGSDKASQSAFDKCYMKALHLRR